MSQDDGGGMMGQKIQVAIPKEKLEHFCKKHHIHKLSVFGSVLRDDFRSDSDVDMLVEFEPDHIPGLIRLAGMECELSEILGRKVDIRTAQDLSRYFRRMCLTLRRSSMRKDDAVRLRHMLDAAKEAVSFAQNKTRRSLDTDRKLVLSLVKSIEIIGEAAANVTSTSREELPHIPWRDIISMRNRLIHA